MQQPQAEAINRWLSQFEGLPLECDGMTRAISYVLAEQGIEHTVCFGMLSEKAPGQSRITHFWIELQGWFIDLCARMWIGPNAPHGLFDPSDVNCCYEQAGTIKDGFQDEFVFNILTERKVSSFEPFPTLPEQPGCRI